MKQIICFLMIMLFQTANSYEIELSRTFNKILVENNQLLIKMDSTGLIEVTYPEFYRDSKQLNFNASTQKLSVIDNLVEKIDRQQSSKMLKNKLNVVKRNNDLPLFYASEVDVIELKIIDNSGLIWNISLDNLPELKQHYDLMGSWQPMLDLVTEMESWAQQAKRDQMEGAKP